VEAKELRKELKKLGISNKDVSVRMEHSGTIKVIVKNLSINIEDIEKLAHKYSRIDYDAITGEILAGGNTYVFVSYDWQVLRKEGEKFLPIAQKILEKKEKNVISNGEYQLCYYFDDTPPHLSINKIGSGGEWKKLPAYDAQQLAEALALCYHLYGFNLI